MSALTPDCDPDLSVCGSPVASAPGAGGGVRSILVLLAVLALTVPVAAGGAVPGVVAFLAGGVALLSGLVLGRRGIRLARRAATAVAVPAERTGAVRRFRAAG